MSRGEEQWEEQYRAAKSVYELDKFALLGRGSVYSWMNLAKDKVKNYDAFLEHNDGSPQQYDEQLRNNCSWTSARIEKVRDMVEAFLALRCVRSNGTKRGGSSNATRETDQYWYR